MINYLNTNDPIKLIDKKIKQYEQKHLNENNLQIYYYYSYIFDNMFKDNKVFKSLIEYLANNNDFMQLYFIFYNNKETIVASYIEIKLLIYIYIILNK